MASFHSITIGQQTELNRIMAQACFRKEDIEAIIADENLARAMFWGYFFEALKHNPELLAKSGFKPAWVAEMHRKYQHGGGFDLQAQP